jgi:hypothetical protein
MIYWIGFYLVGFVLTYWYVKTKMRGTDYNGWDDVSLTIFISLFSWFSLLLFYFLTFLDWCSERKLCHRIKKWFDSITKQPPRWM